uniref:(California timema) hypothetical protein n=1 Tax=Timema californicum TaxID=61474 RepID=A0A7R9P9U7_TIMCA|nr:unnamed protein product [Timema californicum]
MVSIKRFNDYTNYYEVPPSDPWTGSLVQSHSGIATSTTPLWRTPRIPAPKPLQLAFYPGEDPHTNTQDSWRDHDNQDIVPGAAVVTPHGTICLRLPHRVRVDLTIDRAVRIINFKVTAGIRNSRRSCVLQNNIVLSLNESGSSAALLHPNGRIYQYGSRVEILAHDVQGNNKYAKMWYKGVSFTSDQCALVYLVDAAGTRTTTDSFSDLSQDLSLSVYYNESRHGAPYIQEAKAILDESQYWLSDEGIENWIINNVRVSQTPDGLVRVARNSNKYLMRTSPTNGTASLTTPFLHCTASLGQTSHLFVRRGERRMHFDCTSFIVRNAGHSAGFDEKNQLKVY